MRIDNNDYHTQVQTIEQLGNHRQRLGDKREVLIAITVEETLQHPQRSHAHRGAVVAAHV